MESMYADGRGYSAEGSRSNEGSVENAISNGNSLAEMLPIP